MTKCEDQFECNNDRCVELSAKCDGINDCGDWTDESKLLCGGELDLTEISLVLLSLVLLF